MKKTIFLVLCACHSAIAATHYVDLNSPSPAAPYTNWATAAHNIQDAVDEATAGETVRVADGTYSLSSQITVAEDITVQSVNGWADTVVDGNGTNRCFNLGGTSSQLIGFTVANGYTRGFWDRPVNMGGGVYCADSKPMIRDCYLVENHAGFGGAIMNGTASNCVFIGNSAGYSRGGGIYEGTATDCVFINNTAGSGGGMADNNALRCVFYGNESSSLGGGMLGGSANSCIFVDNSAILGGGVYDLYATNCVLIGNTAGGGGGAAGGYIHSCLVADNHASNSGGGILYGYEVKNCTVVNNSCGGLGGGVMDSAVTNSIVWGNKANETGKNIYNSTAVYSCSPDLSHGIDGNITNRPVLDSSYYPLSHSPTIDAGSNDPVASAEDLDGNPRIVGGRVDMGAYEWAAGARIEYSVPVVVKQDAHPGISPDPMEIEISNSGSSSFTFTVQEDAAWMDISPVSGSCGGASTLTVTFDTDDLPVGFYYGTITIEAPGTSNHPLKIGVVLEVYVPVLERFEWGSTPVVQLRGAPFAAAIYAKDQNDNVYEPFTGQVNLSALKTEGHFTSHVSIAPVQTTPFTAGIWQDYVTLGTQGSNITMRIDDGNGAGGVSSPMVAYNPVTDGDADGMADYWERYYFSAIANCLPGIDEDDDGRSNFEEFMEGTDPTNSVSRFRPAVDAGGGSGTVIAWESVSGREYRVQRCPDLIVHDYANVLSYTAYPLSNCTDTVHSDAEVGFYRIEVRLAE